MKCARCDKEGVAFIPSVIFQGHYTKCVASWTCVCKEHYNEYMADFDNSIKKVTR
jgi:hypothetical protein